MGPKAFADTRERGGLAMPGRRQVSEQRMQSIGRMVRMAGTAALVVALAGGCASIKDHRGYLIDQALIDSVQPGVDNKMSVERALGRPTFVSQFGDAAWYYVAIDTQQAPFQAPETSRETVLRVTFDPAGNVANVDRRNMDKVVEIDPDGDKTPTLGRERGLIEDIFGNIGSVGAPGAGGGGAPGS
jgi:outer membrane protein assembly factor BamE (lipoprotein component of BamABCDE complex)